MAQFVHFNKAHLPEPENIFKEAVLCYLKSKNFVVFLQY